MAWQGLSAISQLASKYTLRAPGFEPELEAWEAPVIPDYTTPAAAARRRYQIKRLLALENPQSDYGYLGNTTLNVLPLPKAESRCSSALCLVTILLTT